ncbi:phosphotransferase family protein [Streptomyces sp. NPDC001415]
MSVGTGTWCAGSPTRSRPSCGPSTTTVRRRLAHGFHCHDRGPPRRRRPLALTAGRTARRPPNPGGRDGYALDEVTEPRLVHFDLWPGNIFAHPGDDTRPVRITGLIDHERAFWGDPAAELVSPAFDGDAGPDSDLATGCAPRGYGGDHLAFCHGMLAEAVVRLRAPG